MAEKFKILSIDGGGIRGVYSAIILREIENKFNIKLEYLSAGNSSSLKLLESGKIPSRINHFRIGEGILLGRETLYREKFPDTYQDAFILSAEIIEKKLKPSVPIGEIGQDAFGNIPSVKDKGMMTRCILNVVQLRNVNKK